MTRGLPPLGTLALVLALALVAGPRPTYAAPQHNEPASASQLGEAERALHQGRYRRALELAGSAAADAPLTDHKTQSAALTVRARVLVDLGQFDEAGEALDAALAALANTSLADQLVDILVARGELRWTQGRVDEARASFDEAAAWNDALPSRPLAARIERARGRLARFQRHHREALARYDSARTACAGAEADICAASADLGAGFVHIAAGDPVRARRAFSAAWGVVAARDLARDEAQTLWGLAVAARALSEPTLAVAQCDRALEIARRIKNRPLLAGLHALRGELALDVGDHDVALRHLEAAHEHFAAMRSVPGVAESRLVLAKLALARGRAPEAQIHAQVAHDAFETLGDGSGLVASDGVLADLARRAGHTEAEAHWITHALGRGPAPAEAMSLWRRLGTIARDRGDVGVAADHFGRAVEAAERMPLTSGTEATSATRLATYDDLLAAVAEQAAVGPTVDRALEIAERSAARAFSDLLERARLRREQPQAAALIERIDALDRAEQELVGAGLVTDEARLRQLQRLGSDRFAAQRALLGLSPRWLAPGAPDASLRIARDIARVRQELRDDVVVIEYHLADPVSFAFAVTQEGTRLVTLMGRHALAPIAQRFADTLARPAVTLEQRRRQRQLGEALYGALVTPLEGAIGTHRRLLIVPHRELRLVPFDALVLPASKATVNERKDARLAGCPPYLLFRYTISYAPSLAALAELSEDARRRQGTRRHPFVAFADPIYSGVAAELPRLTRASGEARSASEHLTGPLTPGTLFLGADATENRLKRLALSRYRVIHLATHGYAPDTVTRDEQPALFLGAGGDDDGVLRLDEVLDLRLDADLVVLSACSSGRGSLDPGDGLGGLTQAFLYAGSSAVMATLWAVEDRHAAAMMEVFYDQLGGGASSPESLRAARLALVTGGEVGGAVTLRGIGGIVDPTTDDAPAHHGTRRVAQLRSADPFFWASYILMGESGDLVR